MRRIQLLFVAILFVVTATSCTSEKTALQEATGASKKKAEIIEEILAHHDITYSTVAVSNNPFLVGMDPNWHAFDLIKDDGTTHVLILRKSDNDFTAVLDSEGRNIEGMLDDGVVPALFENGAYKFQ